MSIEIMQQESPYVQYPFVYVDSFGQQYVPKMDYDADTDSMVASPDMVSMDNVAGNVFRQQSQYASRWIDGAFGEYPNLGYGLHYEGSSINYHEIAFHHADIPELLRRVIAWRTAFQKTVFDYEIQKIRCVTPDEALQGRMYFGGLAISTELS